MMYIIKNVLFSFFMLLTTLSFSQCVDFSLKPSACLNEVLEIESLSTGTFYQWDFCEGDLMAVPQIGKLTTFSGFNDIRGLDIIFDGFKWYGFFTDKTKNSLIRIDFGLSLTNSMPISTELGNIEGQLNGPEPIKILKEANEWYGIIHNKGDLSLIKLHFGSSLANTPTASLILAGVGSDGTNLDYSYTNDSLVVVLSNFTSANFTTVNLGSSINNKPTIDDYFSFSGLTYPSDISLISQCDKWYGISLDFFSRKAFLLNFGSSLFSIPNITEIGTSIFSTNPRRTQILKDQNNYIVLSVSTTGKVHRINLGPDLENIVPIYTDLGINGGMNRTESLAIVKEGSSWTGFSMDRLFGNFYQMVFPNTCSSSQEVSSEKNPKGVYYTSEGTYNVGLKIFDEKMQLLDDQTKSIVIGAMNSPKVTVEYNNVCLSSNIAFASINNSIDGQILTSWAWDFGDGSPIETGQADVAHKYANVGSFEVSLSVESDISCGQIVYTNIIIYDEPIPDYTIPGGNICTNQPYSFVNTTLDNFDGLLTYDWQLDGVSVGTSRDLGITFLTGGTKELKLIATIPGCSIEIAKILTSIKEGILPQFTFDDSCVGELVTFNNTSVGTPTDIAWDFGNGFNSSLANPSLEYATDGTYDVTMTLTNADGCVTFDTQTITIHPLPTVSFSNELACELLETQFNDLSSVTLDNLSSWTWDFDDQSTNSTEQNPLHSFAMAGDYNVKLITESTFGCIDSLQQTVSVFEAPDAAFSLDKICVDVPIQFTDESVPIAGENIVDWAWNLGGIFDGNQDPQMTFTNALDYTISLTVTSENLCTSTQSQSISIAPTPTVAFEVSDDCENQTALLSDITSISRDTINQWNWNLGSSSIGSGNQISNIFSNSGSYNVTLSILTENGCAYEVTQTFPIHEVPVAAFNPSFPFGAPPFIVDFSNQSTGATNYQWSFEEGANSLESEPSYTFQNLGDFDVQLVAINDQNCRDTATQRIEVLQPLLDLEVRNLSLIPSINTDILSITVRNNGTIRMDSVKVGINLGGELELFEKINTRINPDETITAQLSLQLINKKLDYICVSIASYLLNIEDDLISNNDKCITLNNQDIIIFPPYPNPVSNEVKFEVITTNNQSAIIEIINSRGASVSTFETKLESGSNNLVLNMEALVKGLYLIRMNIGGQISIFKVVLEK